MPQKPDITLKKTTQFLQEKYSNGISQLTQLSGGEWSQAFSFLHETRKYLLRWCFSQESFEKDTYAFHFNHVFLPIPEILYQGKSPEAYYAISPFCEGEFLEKLSAKELCATMPSLLNMFEALRVCDISHSRGYGSWDVHGNGGKNSWHEYLLDVNNDNPEDIIHGWKIRLKAMPDLADIFERLYAMLENNIESCPENRELIHSDLLNNNLMVDRHNISAVIDWQCSLYGDSLYDIAWFLYYAPWYPQFEKNSLGEKLITHFSDTSNNSQKLERRLLCYYLHIGLGSIAYNSFKQDWQAAKQAADYTQKIIGAI